MNNHSPFPQELAIATACVVFNAEAASTINFDTDTIKPTPLQNAAIRRAATVDIQKFDHPQQDDWRVARVDLNGDGHPDLLVQYTYDSSFCGSAGCSGAIVMAAANGYATETISLPNFMNRMIIMDTRHQGMPELNVDYAKYVFTWSGHEYR